MFKSQTIVENIAELNADLHKVRCVEAIVGQPATDKIGELESNIAALQDDLAKALADEADMARKELLASFSDISVNATHRANCEPSILTASYQIAYERLTYDMGAKANVPTVHKCNGFAALPAEAFAYLIEIRPDAIPADILALSPDDAREAFNRYFAGLRRGYIIAMTEAA